MAPLTDEGEVAKAVASPCAMSAYVPPEEFGFVGERDPRRALLADHDYTPMDAVTHCVSWGFEGVHPSAVRLEATRNSQRKERMSIRGLAR